MASDERAPLITEATAIMFEEARQGQSFMSQWADAIDAKVLGVFGAASGLIGIVPALGGVKADGLEWVPWIVAGIAWAMASLCCWAAYGTQSFEVGPNPSRLLEPEWADLDAVEYRYFRIRDMGKAWSHNQRVINAKAESLGRALPFVGLESAALLLALFVQQ